MLFSNESVADYINEYFEPAWESVRAVPTVTIDFGNGTVITRTLHGNVATYACNPDGTVLDILPGVYDPTTFVDRLDQLAKLYAYVNEGRSRERENRFKIYHEEQHLALKNNQEALRFEEQPIRSITGIERGTYLTLQPARRIAARGRYAQQAKLKMSITEIDETDKPNWESLADDTRINETIRRQAIHEHLMNSGLVQPEAITKWIYREVLNANLDDPYLGLGPVLFDNYPFAEEDGISGQ